MTTQNQNDTVAGLALVESERYILKQKMPYKECLYESVSLTDF